MPKKEWTPEARKEFGEKMKKAREAKKKKMEADLAAEPPESSKIIHDTVGEATEEEHPQPRADETISKAQYDDLLRQIQEIKAAGFDNLTQAPQGAQVTNKGVVGIVDKHVIDPKAYPDPREELSNERLLQRFAFKDNYELEFEVTFTQYEAKDGINYREPKFNLQLNRIVFDERTGEATVGRYIIAKFVMHEDPQAALMVAQENGIDVPEAVEQAFLDRMRYLQMRDWLVGCFLEPLPTARKEIKEMVVGGKLVQYFEVSNEEADSIPFDQLKDKKADLR